MLASARPAPATAAIDLTAIDAVGVAAGILLDGAVWGIEPVTGSGNNRVFRAQTGQGPLAVKFYPRQEADARDRLGPEVAALRLLEQYGVAQVPNVIAECPQGGVAAYTWIDGERIKAPTEAHIDSAIRLILELRALVEVLGAQRIGPASAATFSGHDVFLQISTRLSRIRAVANEHPSLSRFLEESFAPAFERITAWAEDVYARAGLRFGVALANSERTLSPSDFGFHNALQDKAGRTWFLDFEYFGWDDPAKMVSDFLHHPGMQLAPALRRRFLLGARSVFGGANSAFATRLHALYPLFGLCWVLILLNEFLPERWARRALSRTPSAGESMDALREAVQAHQLTKARALLERIEATYANGPDA